MCDYSLAVLPNRLAVEGEELVVHRFYTGARGLASPADLQVPEPAPAPRKTFWERLKSVFEDPRRCANVAAVCIPPGARLRMTAIPEDFQRQWDVGNEECVLFTQLSANENHFRDALRFANGREVLLQELCEGMPVRVLSLGCEDVSDELELSIQSVKSVVRSA
jgi:hypothetical protein